MLLEIKFSNCSSEHRLSFYVLCLMTPTSCTLRVYSPHVCLCSCRASIQQKWYITVGSATWSDSLLLKSLRPLMVKWALGPCRSWCVWLNVQHSYKNMNFAVFSMEQAWKMRTLGCCVPLACSAFRTQLGSCSIKQDRLWTAGLNCSHLQGNGERCLRADLLWKLKGKIIVTMERKTSESISKDCSGWKFSCWRTSDVNPISSLGSHVSPIFEDWT